MKDVLRRCRSGEVKVWQAAVAEEGMKLTFDVVGEITISPSAVADEKRFSIRCEVNRYVERLELLGSRSCGRVETPGEPSLRKVRASEDPILRLRDRFGSRFNG